MQRRSLLKLGAAATVVLVLAGGTAAVVRPGLRDGRLTDAARAVFAALGNALLDGSLPAPGPVRQLALQGLLERIDALTQSLPPHAQAELSQLLALLAAAPGRIGIAGLATPWPEADMPAIQHALSGMRTSSLALRQQAYHALHDIVGGAYFSDAGTWLLLGYPGPRTI